MGRLLRRVRLDQRVAVPLSCVVRKNLLEPKSSLAGHFHDSMNLGSSQAPISLLGRLNQRRAGKENGKNEIDNREDNSGNQRLPEERENEQD